jgi:hypothetical protein
MDLARPNRNGDRTATRGGDSTITGSTGEVKHYAPGFSGQQSISPTSCGRLAKTSSRSGSHLRLSRQHKGRDAISHPESTDQRSKRYRQIATLKTAIRVFPDGRAPFRTGPRGAQPSVEERHFKVTISGPAGRGHFYSLDAMQRDTAKHAERRGRWIENHGVFQKGSRATRAQLDGAVCLR